jgi:hypothetical protein
LADTAYVAAMTATETITPAGAKVAGRGGPWRLEFAETVRLAAPMALTQLGALGLGVAFIAAMTLIVALARHAIPHVFLGAEAPQSAETIALAATLLVLAASFFITDGAQTVAAGALRGLNDTRVPLLFSALSFWAVGFLSSLWLGFPMGSAPSACGSACRWGRRSMRGCCCGGSTC